MISQRRLTLSIISHQQGQLIHGLLDDLQEHCADLIEVILTLNLQETLPFTLEEYGFPIHLRLNSTQKGFAANHNAAFQGNKGKFFCILNPDIRLKSNPFMALMECFKDDRVAVAAPLIVNQLGKIEDSARRFPSPFSILTKALIRTKQYDYSVDFKQITPDWVAGMFMLFSADILNQFGGFNEKYFLYYEDVDLCARFKLFGYKIVFCPSTSVIHNARRESHRNLKYLSWHISSAFRFFSSKIFFDVAIRKRGGRKRF